MSKSISTKSKTLFASLMVLFVISIPIAFAADISGSTLGSLSALGSGYGIGRWPYSSGDVPLGSSVQVRVATTDPSITHVILLWKADEVTVYTTGKLAVTASGDTWGSLPINDTYNTQVLSVVGDWGVQAYFYDDWDAPFEGQKYSSGKVAIRAISFHPNVIPEVPYGTIATLTTMLGALYVFYTKRG